MGMKGVKGVREGSNRCWCEKEANCLKEGVRARGSGDDRSEGVWGPSARVLLEGCAGVRGCPLIG